MARIRGDYWPGLGERMRQRLLTLGFEQARHPGRVDLLRFVREKGLPQNSSYRWLKESKLTRASAEQLATALGVSWIWLLVGDPVSMFAPTGAKANGHRNGPRAAGGALAPLPARRQQALTATASVPARRVSRKVASKQAKRQRGSIMTTRNPWWLGGSTPLRRAA